MVMMVMVVAVLKLILHLHLRNKGQEHSNHDTVRYSLLIYLASEPSNAFPNSFTFLGHPVYAAIFSFLPHGNCMKQNSVNRQEF